MLIIVHSQTSSNILALPEELLGSHSIVDAEGNELICAKATKRGWELSPAAGKTFAGDVSQKTLLVCPQDSTVVPVHGGESEWTVICRPNTEGDKKTDIIGFSRDVDVTIGRADDNSMVYASQFVSSHHACLMYRDGKMYVQDLGSTNGVFINGLRAASRQTYELQSGDAVSILGLTIVIGKGFISYNHPGGRVEVKDLDCFIAYEPPESLDLDRDTLDRETEYFYPALRFMRSIEKKSFVIDQPPQKERQDETPLLMRIGPSLIMGFAAVMSASVSISFMMGQDGGMLRAIPLICMAIAMLAGSVLWPILNKRYEKKRYAKQEALRKGAYAEYLSKVRSELLAEAEAQASILQENCITPQECLVHAQRADDFFMSETPLHQDYLNVRLGIGDVDLAADIRFPDLHFQVEEDDLLDVIEKFSHEPTALHDVPVSLSLIDVPIMGVVGDVENTSGLIRNVIVQLVSRHAYDGVKIVFLTDERDARRWHFVRYLPHVLDDEGSTRFFATTLEGANELGMYLDRQLAARSQTESFDARDAEPYFIIICTSKNVYDRSDFIKRLLALKVNLGFAFIAAAWQMHELPRQCKSVLRLESAAEASLLNRDDVSGKSKKIALDQFVTPAQVERLIFDLTKKPLEIGALGKELPDSLGFLEMYDVSQVEDLNVWSRWRENSGAVTLAAQVGLDQLGEPFMLNLHEKIHGPHGLIAGTTGSGKSEFIISYILSMAASYSPDDVSFVLIDYKGGGLAKAFQNDRFTLPHLAGTITNLDGAAIKRSLATIKSELKRRQRLLNDAREAAGGDNVDIYKYLDMYRQGRVTEKCPHLIIIADEFAELKQQQPEFMDELISAARIGRSLGVHLILATQKPSGVVNDQIWSNARFKISLKVAEAADSQEVIRTADAAEIKQPGRFYLMVGYNELYALGQSGYSGGSYAPDAVSDKNDPSVEYVGDTGRVLLTMKPRREKSAGSKKSELVAVLEHIVDVAEQHDCKAQPLWLAPLREYILLDELLRKYGYVAEDDFNLTGVLGEYDAPERQEQHLLTVPLSEGGNLAVYGSSDAGAETMLQAMIYSLISAHDPQTLNVYLFDFGSQALTAFAGAPQVGDVVLPNEDEKVHRFFDYMSVTIARRRERFKEYGGSYERYCADHDDCPAILVVFNGIAAFMDIYESCEDALYRFLREAESVGIRVIARAESCSAMRMRMRNSFPQSVCCELVDASDYSMLFGPVRDTPLPKGFGRGLVSVDGSTYLFQTASVAEQGTSAYEHIASMCKMQAVAYDVPAPAIPVAPEHVSPEQLAQVPTSSLFVPFGVYDDTLAVAGFDFFETPLARCVFQKRKAGAAFVSALIETAVAVGKWDVTVLDTLEVLPRIPDGCFFSTHDKEKAGIRLKEALENAASDEGEARLYVVSGIVGLLSSLDFNFSGEVKEYLERLRAGGRHSFILFDAVDSADYAYEDWFKAQSSTKDGLWVGGGVSDQTKISISNDYALEKSFTADKPLGYIAEFGVGRMVHLVENAALEKEAK